MNQNLKNYTSFIGDQWEGARDVIEYSWGKSMNIGGLEADAFHLASYEALLTAWNITKDFKGLGDSNLNAVETVGNKILEELRKPEYLSNLSDKCARALEEHKGEIGDYSNLSVRVQKISSLLKPRKYELERQEKESKKQELRDFREQYFERGLDNTIKLVDEFAQYFSELDLTRSSQEIAENKPSFGGKAYSRVIVRPLDGRVSFSIE